MSLNVNMILLYLTDLRVYRHCSSMAVMSVLVCTLSLLSSVPVCCKKWFNRSGNNCVSKHVRQNKCIDSDSLGQ